MSNADPGFEMTRRVVMSRAMEALKGVYERMPFDGEFALPNGEDVIIKPFVEPKICDYEDHPYKGRPCFGFDIRDKDGNWHLECFVFIVGWGGNPIVK